jgi:hypothetical protein
LILSVITVHSDFWADKEEMLIPVCIGGVSAAMLTSRRLNRMLPTGHRLRGYEE